MTYGDIAKKLGGVELSRDVRPGARAQPVPDRVPATASLAAATSPAAFPRAAAWRRNSRCSRSKAQAVDHTPNLFD